ncbi:MAG: hypothetical protein K6T86_06540 [Pirellulales bacterium]|nr:hypothetical protein [Pirellulales bacterium]
MGTASPRRRLSRRFSLAGLLLVVAVFAVLLAALGTIPQHRLTLRDLEGGIGAAMAVGWTVAMFVVLRYPRMGWGLRLLSTLLGSSVAAAATVICLRPADPRTLLMGTGVMVAATFCLRSVRVWRHERRLSSELQAAGSPNARHNAGGQAASHGELADAN